MFHYFASAGLSEYRTHSACEGRGHQSERFRGEAKGIPTNHNNHGNQKPHPIPTGLPTAAYERLPGEIPRSPIQSPSARLWVAPAKINLEAQVSILKILATRNVHDFASPRGSLKEPYIIGLRAAMGCPKPKSI